MLFVRPWSADDHHALRSLFRREGHDPPHEVWGADGLVAKLAGDLVGHAAYLLGPAGELELIHLYVARDLRRKRIGRGIVIELEGLAVTLGCHRIVARADCAANSFLSRLGFTDRDAMLQKRVP